MEYMCYLHAREEGRVSGQSEFSGVTVFLETGPGASMQKVKELFDLQYPGYGRAWEAVAFEPYTDYVTAAHSGRWGSGPAFYGNRSRWLMKEATRAQHPSGHLQRMETLYTVEGALGDSDGNPTVIGTMDDAMEFARRCFPGLDQQGWTEKLKPINVWLIK